MIQRRKHVQAARDLMRQFPVVALIGARQVGKTTLARQVIPPGARPRPTVFDLENPGDLSGLSERMLALESLKGPVVIDEVQRRPELFQVLRVLADRPKRPASFLVLGSASPALLRQSSESLAGRIAYYELKPFSLDEVGPRAVNRLWLRRVTALALTHARVELGGSV